MKLNRKKIYQVFGVTVWTFLGFGLIFLLVSAVKKEDAAVCKNVNVIFADNLDFRMLEENEILASLWPDAKNGFPFGTKPDSFDLYTLEKRLAKNPWILNADLFFDQQHNLNIEVVQRNPIARVFSPSGSSFYLDETFAMLPVKSNEVLSLPVFTNFYFNPSMANASDSAILKRMVSLSKFISADSLWMAQVEEVYINPDGGFELTTQLGDQNVMLGVRDDWQNMFMKLDRMYSFFTQAHAWNQYKKIDLQFKDQVVCEKKYILQKSVDSIPINDSTIMKKFD